MPFIQIHKQSHSMHVFPRTMHAVGIKLYIQHVTAKDQFDKHICHCEKGLLAVELFSVTEYRIVNCFKTNDGAMKYLISYRCKPISEIKGPGRCTSKHVQLNPEIVNLPYDEPAI